MVPLIAGVVVEVAKTTKNWSPGLSPAGVVIVKGIALASVANPTVSIRARNASQDVRSLAPFKEGGRRAASTESNCRRIAGILKKDNRWACRRTRCSTHRGGIDSHGTCQEICCWFFTRLAPGRRARYKKNRRKVASRC